MPSGRDGKARRRLAGENSDGVFELRALDAKIGGLRSGYVQLGLRLCDILIGGNACLVAGLR